METTIALGLRPDTSKLDLQIILFDLQIILSSKLNIIWKKQENNMEETTVEIWTVLRVCVMCDMHVHDRSSVHYTDTLKQAKCKFKNYFLSVLQRG